MDIYGYTDYGYSRIDNICYIIILMKVKKALIILNKTNNTTESSTQVNKWRMHKLTENRRMGRNWYVFMAISCFGVLKSYVQRDILTSADSSWNDEPDLIFRSNMLILRNSYPSSLQASLHAKIVGFSIWSCNFSSDYETKKWALFFVFLVFFRGGSNLNKFI